MDHRVEPPAWLPQGAAPEAADPEADESPAVEDTQAAEDGNAAEAAPEEFANGNGHDSNSSADSYRYSDDNSFAEGTSYRSPFTPQRGPEQTKNIAFTGLTEQPVGCGPHTVVAVNQNKHLVILGSDLKIPRCPS